MENHANADIFHCVPLALIDPDFAKEQLLLLLRGATVVPNLSKTRMKLSCRPVRD
jgi:hypothetical protein